VEELTAPLNIARKISKNQNNRKNITRRLMSRWYRAHNKRNAPKNPGSAITQLDHKDSVLDGSGSLDIGTSVILLLTVFIAHAFRC
jgi:hypothetical protein